MILVLSVIYNQYGGKADATGGMGWLTIGHTGSGTYNLYGGEVLAKYIDLGYQTENNTVGGILNVYGGKVTSQSSFSVGNSGSHKGYGELNIHGGEVSITGDLDAGNSNGSVNFYAGKNGFGTLSAKSASFTGKYTVGLSDNGIVSMQSFDHANGYNIFTLTGGNTIDTTDWTISPLFHVSGSGTGTLNLKFAQDALADYIIDESGKLNFDATSQGWVNVQSAGMTYAMELEFDNLLDRDAFLDWINESDPYSAQAGSTANSVEFLLFDPSATLFAFDFSNYENGGTNLTASGISGRTYVPEPAAWLLLSLGLLWVGKKRAGVFSIRRPL
ncbi:MAG: PEP-CTERM sorting domain-containing protein [Planctomycetia bacterium]|nr:PEP-CTERM sorting domain-containing protein [Planctomycetia bacterium]